MKKKKTKKSNKGIKLQKPFVIKASFEGAMKILVKA